MSVATTCVMSSVIELLDAVERGSGEFPWVIQLTLRRKPMGTIACWKSRHCLKACRERRGKTCVIRRMLYCVNFSVQRCKPHIPRNHAWRGHRLTAAYVVTAGTLGRRAEANEASQGYERSAYVTLVQLTSENMRSPKGREPYGDGVPVVVRDRESRSHGEGGQVSSECQHKGGTRDA